MDLETAIQPGPGRPDDRDRAGDRALEILESITDAFFSVDRAWRFTYVNRQAHRLLGRPPGDLVGKVLWDEYPGLLGTEVEGACRRTATERVTSAVVAYYPADGRWFEVHAYPAENGLTISFRDATETRLVDAAIRRSEESQRLVVAINDSTRHLRDPEAVTRQVVTLVGRHFRVSRCMFAEVDAGRDRVRVAWDFTEGVPSVVGIHRLEAFGPGLVRELSEGRTVAIDDVVADRRTSDTRSATAFADIQARAVLTVPLIKDGVLIALFSLHQADARRWSADEISLMEQLAQRSWFAMEHARAEAAVRESRDVLALAMRGGRMGAWSRNLATNEVWWSRELEALFELPPGGFDGTEDGFFAFVHEDDRKAVVTAVTSAIATRGDYVTEFRFRTATGQWRWMDGRGRATYADDGAPTMLYGLGIDITERKAVEEALAAARDAAESANRLKDEFLATLSHELRTPLNAILGYARMLRTNTISPEKRGKAVEVIERNAIAQTQLVEDLLDVSRITSGKVRLDPHTLTAATPLGEAIESIRPAADAKQISLVLDIDPFAGSVHADANRLQQVFWNLLSNAVKFTRHGGRIAVTLQRVDRAVEISISDTGSGISPEFLPFVFEPFRQADGRFAREHGGLGLGLAISKQLIELHGGGVRALSDGPGRGATFVVTLPRKMAPEEAHDRGAVSFDRRTRSSALAPFDDLDVLLVDNEPDSLELLRQVLENVGATVRTVSRGADALAEFDRQAPDLVVTDLGLPEMDGYELLRRLKGRAGGSRVPAIAVTAYARHADRSRVLAAGFAAHVAKPIDPDALIAALLAAIQPD